jgi:hypothetical protein
VCLILLFIDQKNGRDSYTGAEPGAAGKADQENRYGGIPEDQAKKLNVYLALQSGGGYVYPRNATGYYRGECTWGVGCTASSWSLITGSCCRYAGDWRRMEDLPHGLNASSGGEPAAPLSLQHQDGRFDMQLFMSALPGIPELSLVYGYFKLLDGMHSTDRDIYSIAKGQSLAHTALPCPALPSPAPADCLCCGWLPLYRVVVVVSGVYVHKTGRLMLRSSSHADTEGVAITFDLPASALNGTDLDLGGGANNATAEEGAERRVALRLLKVRYERGRQAGRLGWADAHEGDPWSGFVDALLTHLVTHTTTRRAGTGSGGRCSWRWRLVRRGRGRGRGTRWLRRRERSKWARALARTQTRGWGTCASRACLRCAARGGRRGRRRGGRRW